MNQDEVAGATGRKSRPSKETRTSQGFLETGDSYLRQGDCNRAIRQYRLGLKLCPTDPRLYFMLAEACGRKGWYITARTLYCRAFSLDPYRSRRLQGRLTLLEPQRQSPPDLLKSVFVLGCGHSGTTILARILANHPSLTHAEQRESHVFVRPEPQLRNTLQDWDANCRARGKSGWVEKSVTHCFQVPRILSYRPNAKFVIIIRDGRDVTCSMKTRQYSYRSFNELVGLWVGTNRTILHYRDTPGFHVVRYEHLVRKSEKVLEGICAFIGERFDRSMLDYHLREISWSGASGAGKSPKLAGHGDHQRLRHWQVNQPLFDGSGRWRAEMTDDEKSAFKAIAGRELEEWGFASNGDW